MTRTIPLAKYVFTRLKQQGVRDVYGVPGDFTLKAIDHLKHSGLRWIANCNELNAGYAADGSARIKGLSALFTTYGVGELSAINAVAGSYAEHVPVVHLVASPARHLQESGAIVHHTLGDGRSGVFREIYEKVTVACSALWDTQIAQQMIDDSIVKCLRESRPVYIDIPCDLVPAPVPEERLEEELNLEPSLDAKQEDQLVEFLVRRLELAQHPLFLIDSGNGMRPLKTEINRLVRSSGIPTLTMPSGASMVDHAHQNYFGVHGGPVGKIDTMPLMNSADLVIVFGPMFSDTQSLGWSILPSPDKTITITKNLLQFPDSKPPATIDARHFLTKLADKLQATRSTRMLPDFPDFRALTAPPAKLTDPIDQDSLYLHLNPYLCPNDIIILANATPIIGGRDFILPSGAQVIASGMWFSIGHMLPAALGVALAQQSRSLSERGRTILFEGDGSFQVTAQELSTIIQYKLDVTIFIINNGGYAYERQIHGMNEDYNDVPAWRYTEAPWFFGAVEGDESYPIETHVVRTWGDLETVIASERFCEGKGLKLVDVRVGKYDVPEKFKPVFKAAAEKL